MDKQQRGIPLGTPPQFADPLKEVRTAIQDFRDQCAKVVLGRLLQHSLKEQPKLTELRYKVTDSQFAYHECLTEESAMDTARSLLKDWIDSAQGEHREVTWYFVDIHEMQDGTERRAVRRIEVKLHEIANRKG